MERSLVWGALAIGCACWLVCFTLTRGRRFAIAGIGAALPPTVLGAAAALPLLMYLITLPSHGRIFAAGHDLGNGFLIGGLGALLSSILVIQHILAKPGETSPLRTAAVTAAPAALAAAAAAIPLLMPRQTLFIALMGVAIGWLAISALLLVGLMTGGKGAQANRPEAVSIVAGACFAVLLCSAVTLGDMHGSVTFIKASMSVSYGALALAFGASIPLYMVLAAIPDMLTKPAPRRADSAPAAGRYKAAIGRVAIVVAGVGVTGRLLSNRVLGSEAQIGKPSGHLGRLLFAVEGPSKLFHVIGIGLVMGLVTWWIAANASGRDTEDDDTRKQWQNGVLGIFVVLAAAMAAFEMLAGYGIGLMLLAAFPAALLALRRSLEPGAASEEAENGSDSALEPALRVVQLAGMGAVLTLFRVYTEVTPDLFPRNPYTDQYAVLGLVAGLALPAMIAGYAQSPTGRSGKSPVNAMLRLAIGCLVLLAVPSFLLLLWGQRCAVAFLTAMAVSATGIGVATASGTLAGGIRRLFPTLYALCVPVAMCEWVHYLALTSDWTRVQKERVVIQIIVVLGLMVLATDYGARLIAWRGRGAVKGMGR